MLQAFEALEDPRSRKCPYPLQELLLVALSALTRGTDDWVSLVQWGATSAASRLVAVMPRAWRSGGNLCTMGTTFS
jgi:hypothetical protein